MGRGETAFFVFSCGSTDSNREKREQLGEPKGANSEMEGNGVSERARL